MKTTIIKVPKGYEIDSVDKSTGEVTFKEIPRNVRTEIKGWSDILKYHNHTEQSFSKSCEGLLPHEIGHRKELMIVEAYNQGNKPDFSDGTLKYSPWFTMSSSGRRFAYNDHCAYWNTGSIVGARQLFVGPDAYENMMDAVKKFLPEYEESRTL